MASEPQFIEGDCRVVLASLPESSVDAIVTDPPYELGFMGKRWDNAGVAYDPATWAAALRVLKPGGHLVAFGAPRTYHRLTCAIEDAGFEIRDCLMWLFGSGFPKSLDVSKALDKRKDWNALASLQTAIRIARQALGISQSEAARRIGMIAEGETLGGGGFMWFETGMRIPSRDEWPRLKAALSLTDEYDSAFEAAEREIIGEYAEERVPGGFGEHRFSALDKFITAPATDLAREWAGWGTALKPAYEPIVMARKPLIGTVAANVAAYGVGGINIDGCRIGDAPLAAHGGGVNGDRVYGGGAGIPAIEAGSNAHVGRWPANVALDEGAAVMLDAQTGETTGAFAPVRGTEPTADGLSGPVYGSGKGRAAAPFYVGGASRFFYTAKTSRAEREFGLDDLDAARRADAESRDVEAPGSNNPRLRVNERRNDHPTVKPVDLMRWLCRLITPPGGLIVDPFLGSGSTGMAALDEGFRFIGIDLEPRYIEIARRRIQRRHLIDPLPQATAGQGNLF